MCFRWFIRYHRGGKPFESYFGTKSPFFVRAFEVEQLISMAKRESKINFREMKRSVFFRVISQTDPRQRLEGREF